MRYKRARLLGVLLVAMLAALVAPGRPAEATFPGQNGNIAFERFGDVYLAAPDGSVARKIDVVGVQANPADGLRPGTTYVATVEAGSGGPRDLAGNALAAQKTWSFTVRR